MARNCRQAVRALTKVVVPDLRRQARRTGLLGFPQGALAAADIDQVANDFSAAENGIIVFASSTGRQYSLENPAWGNGAFTKAVVEGLTGKADIRDKGEITVSLLEYYISERVKELTNGQQTPTTAKPVTVPDFPIAVR